MKNYCLILLLPLCFLFLQSCDSSETDAEGTANVTMEDLSALETALDEIDEEIITTTSNSEVTSETDVPAGDVDYTYVIEENVDQLPKALASHAKTAAEKGQTPFVYFTASWCPPCQAIKKYANDPEMMDAYNGHYLVEVDYDNVPSTVALAYGVSGIPAWSGLNEDGTTNNLWVDGGAWGANIPANMAPVLKGYFNYSGDPDSYDP